MRADEAVLMRSVYCAHTCIGVLAWRSTHKGEEEVAGHAVSRFRDLEKSRSAIRVLLDLGGDGCLRVEETDLDGPADAVPPRRAQAGLVRRRAALEQSGAPRPRGDLREVSSSRLYSMS
jgi:hypothetical protein